MQNKSGDEMAVMLMVCVFVCVVCVPRSRAAEYSKRRYGPDISNHTALADAWKYLIVSHICSVIHSMFAFVMKMSNNIRTFRLKLIVESINRDKLFSFLPSFGYFFYKNMQI